jgi:hypothetical protein
MNDICIDDVRRIPQHYETLRIDGEIIWKKSLFKNDTNLNVNFDLISIDNDSSNEDKLPSMSYECEKIETFQND